MTTIKSSNYISVPSTEPALHIINIFTYRSRYPLLCIASAWKMSLNLLTLQEFFYDLIQTISSKCSLAVHLGPAAEVARLWYYRNHQVKRCLPLPFHGQRLVLPSSAHALSHPTSFLLTKSLQQKSSPVEAVHWKVLFLNSAELQFHKGRWKSVFRDWTATSLYFAIFKCQMLYPKHQKRVFLVGSVKHSRNISQTHVQGKLDSKWESHRHSWCLFSKDLHSYHYLN